MADLPANATTPAIVTVGGSYDDRLEEGGDRDWIALEVTAGQTLQINVDARGADGLNDSVLLVRDADGNLLEFNDDAGGGSGFNSALIFLVPTTGTVYLAVRGYDDTETGDYTVSVAQTTMPTDVRPALDWGTVQDDTDITVFFAPRGRAFDGYTSEGFNAFEQARFAQAFALVESVTGLTFRTVNSAAAADLKLVLDTNEVDGEFLGYFNPPGEARAGVGVFDGTQWDRQAGGSLEAGGYDFVTIVHELLHGLGLAHPHDNGGGSEIFPGVSSDSDDSGYHGLNQGVFTTMSYNTGYPEGVPGHVRDQWGYEYGPMALDIAVLQAKYGANTSTATGDDAYVLADANRRGTFWDAIWDAGGLDEIRHDGTGAATIDLRAATLRYEVGGGGFVSSVAGIAGGFTIAAGVVIENAVGGAGRDAITGNAAGNVLMGRGGRDSLAGGDGNDDLQGGGGRDVVTGGAGGDNLAGNGGADRFVFVAGDSDAADGDYLADFRGADVIDLRSFGALTFIGEGAFGSSGDGEVRYQVEGNESVLSVDAGGDGVADLVIRLAGVTALDAGDFRLG